MIVLIAAASFGMGIVLGWKAAMQFVETHPKCGWCDRAFSSTSEAKGHVQSCPCNPYGSSIAKSTTKEARR